MRTELGLMKTEIGLMSTELAKHRVRSDKTELELIRQS